jgi:molybdopterin-guanine dinucleotide biosynthesis protein A
MGWRGPASVAGFVLAGGRSSRRGRDKALIPCGDHTLIGHIARVVERACGSVVLVGCPERYRALPYPAIEDALPEQGPLGGIQAALCASSAEWNLVVACDMPLITVELLEWPWTPRGDAPGIVSCQSPRTGGFSRCAPSIAGAA